MDKNLKSCRLLDALYALGATDKKTFDVNAETDTVEITKDKDSDFDTRFDQRYSWKNMEEFLDLVFKTITDSGECLRIPKELNKENMKSFILNFYEMADLIGRNIEKETKNGDISEEEVNSYKVNSKSKDFRKYVIGREGTIYETDVYDNSDADEYLKCSAMELVLNDKFVLDDNLTYTNIKIAIDEKFNDWYDKLLKKIQ